MYSLHIMLIVTVEKTGLLWLLLFPLHSSVACWSERLSASIFRVFLNMYVYTYISIKYKPANRITDLIELI